MPSKKLVNPSAVRNLAGLELNTLLYAKLLPGDIFQGARVPSRGTPIHDLTGEVLFYRVPVVKGRSQVAFADIAAHPVFSSPLLRVSYGQVWDEAGILEKATQEARRYRKRIDFDKARFVAYSYPKVAVQFLKGNEEVLMLEWGTWQPIPAETKRKAGEPPSNFERWSIIRETPARRIKANRQAFEQRLAHWEEIRSAGGDSRVNVQVLDSIKYAKLIALLQFTTDTRELHYSLNNADHVDCYELRGQLTNVWCVAASVQMLLDFYRYNYDQTRIASELGLGTLNNPTGLPYANDGDVVTVIQKLSSKALTAHMTATPNWNEFVSEIMANRPLISFVPGHSRTVAGFTDTRLATWYIFRGLLVYDPWPPTSGVITRWENFDATTYRRTFTAHVTLV